MRAIAHPQAPSGNRRSAILMAATHHFLRSGFEAASLSEISAEAGGSKSTVYSYFPSKAALFHVAIQEEIERVARTVFEPPVDNADVPSTLKGLALQMIGTASRSDTAVLARLCAFEAGHFPDLVRALHDRVLGPIKDAARDFIALAHANGGLNAPDATLAVDQLVALCMPGVRDVLGVGSAPVRAFEVASGRADEAVATFMAAYGAKRADRSS